MKNFMINYNCVDRKMTIVSKGVQYPIEKLVGRTIKILSLHVSDSLINCELVGEPIEVVPSNSTGDKNV